MQEKDTKQEEKEEIETFRELIVGPEKKEREGQLKGMKELFSAMLVENKKEYDTQVSDMKNLFVDILEENRRVFQVQLQDLYKTLPNLINTNIKEQQEQDYIVVNENIEAQKQLDTYSRLDAIKQILLGYDIKQISQAVQETQVVLEKQYEEDQTHIMNLANQVSAEIDKMEKRVSETLNVFCEEIAQRLKSNDEKQADREIIADLLRNIATQIK